MYYVPVIDSVLNNAKTRFTQDCMNLTRAITNMFPNYEKKTWKIQQGTRVLDI